MPRVNAYWPLLAALLLNGCLLPQPDTPIIPPRMGDAMSAPGAAPTAPEIERSAGANAAIAPAPVATAADGTLNVATSGLPVSALTAVSVEDPARVAKSEAVAGGFRFALPAGRYWLEVLVDGQTLRVGQAIEVSGGAARSITLTLSKDPLKAVVQEEVSLAPQASDAATPEEPKASGS